MLIQRREMKCKTIPLLDRVKTYQRISQSGSNLSDIRKYTLELTDATIFRSYLVSQLI